MIITVATKQDINELLHIENCCFDEDNYPLSKQNFLYHIASNNKIFVAKIDNIIVGYVLIFYYRQSIRIYSIATKCEYRAKKVGYNLVMYIQELAKKLNLKKISLEVRVSNHNAINFYNKLDFIKIKDLIGYYPNENGIKMVKYL